MYGRIDVINKLLLVVCQALPLMIASCSLWSFFLSFSLATNGIRYSIMVNYINLLIEWA